MSHTEFFFFFFAHLFFFLQWMFLYYFRWWEYQTPYFTAIFLFCKGIFILYFMTLKSGWNVCKTCLLFLNFLECFTGYLYWKKTNTHKVKLHLTGIANVNRIMSYSARKHKINANYVFGISLMWSRGRCKTASNVLKHISGLTGKHTSQNKRAFREAGTGDQRL